MLFNFSIMLFRWCAFRFVFPRDWRVGRHKGWQRKGARCACIVYTHTHTRRTNTARAHNMNKLCRRQRLQQCEPFRSTHFPRVCAFLTPTTRDARTLRMHNTFGAAAHPCRRSLYDRGATHVQGLAVIMYGKHDPFVCLLSQFNLT